MADLSVTFCGVRFQNPLVLASGVLGITSSTWKYVIENGAGGITTKSLWLKEHKGHDTPVMFGNPYYFMNAVGLPDAGIEKAKEEVGKFLELDIAPLIANVVAGKVDDFAEVSAEIAQLKPALLEVNISCPNVEDELGKPFAVSCPDAARVTSEVKKRLEKEGLKVPIIIKLSPNVEDIVGIAKACADAGADGFTVINTVGPGLAIDVNTRIPILTNRVGGISGPAIKPLAVRFIQQIHSALPELPIIGTGGAQTGDDAVEMMMAGATLVGVGTGVYYRGQRVFKKMANEIQDWCERHGEEKLENIIGTVKM